MKQTIGLAIPHLDNYGSFADRPQKIRKSSLLHLVNTSPNLHLLSTVELDGFFSPTKEHKVSLAQRHGQT